MILVFGSRDILRDFLHWSIHGMIVGSLKWRKIDAYWRLFEQSTIIHLFIIHLSFSVKDHVHFDWEKTLDFVYSSYFFTITHSFYCKITTRDQLIWRNFHLNGTRLLINTRYLIIKRKKKNLKILWLTTEIQFRVYSNRDRKLDPHTHTHYWVTRERETLLKNKMEKLNGFWLLATLCTARWARKGHYRHLIKPYFFSPHSMFFRGEIILQPLKVFSSRLSTFGLSKACWNHDLNIVRL